jgi:uncharacterized iron-regulated membrane protein
MKFPKLNRLFHRWASVVIAVPLLLVILTGVLLLLKKDVAWIQPPTQRGSTTELALGFNRVLELAKSVPEAEIEGWEDIDRLDVRPSKGMLKVRAQNSWEIQIDAASGDILHVAYRRSDLIESLHDGSFFHDKVKLWVFLPSAVVLLFLLVSGLILFIQPYRARRRNRRRMESGAAI